MKVHKDFRGWEKDLRKRDDVEIRRRGATTFDIYKLDAKGEATYVTSLPASTSFTDHNKRTEIRRALERANLLQPARRSTRVSEALEEAAERAGHQKLRDEIVRGREGDDETPDRTLRQPEKVGIVHVPVRTKSAFKPPGGRYQGNGEWAAKLRRDVRRLVVQFTSLKEFAEFAILVAQEHNVQAPGTRSTEDNAWDPKRVYHVVHQVLSGQSNGSSRTLNFIQAAINELDGGAVIPTALMARYWECAEHEERFATQQEYDLHMSTEHPAVVEPEPDETPALPPALATANGVVDDRLRDLRANYAAILIAKVANDPNPSEETLRRIDKALELS